MESGAERQCKKRERLFMAECSNGVGGEHGRRGGREVLVEDGDGSGDKDFAIPPPRRRGRRAGDDAMVDRGKGVPLEDGPPKNHPERSMQRRYSKEALKCILTNSPSGEEEMLRQKGFNDLVHEGLTHVFQVSNKLMLVCYVFSSRRKLLGADKRVMGDLTVCRVGTAS